MLFNILKALNLLGIILSKQRLQHTVWHYVVQIAILSQKQCKLVRKTASLMKQISFAKETMHCCTAI